MDDGVQGVVSSTATEEMLSLFRETPKTRWADKGYVDLLGKGAKIGTTRVQKTMESRIFPKIYERFWRPAAARGFFGRGGPKIDEERQLTVDSLRLSPGDRILDVGCGPGTFTRYLAEITGDGLVVGLDPAGPMLAAAVKRRPSMANIAYLRCDACALPFGDSGFDAICCTGVIHAIDDPMKALDEMVRVLRPGGRMALSATCLPEDGNHHIPKGLKVFGRGELTGSLVELGMEDVEQVVIGQAQLVSARKAEG